MSTTKRGFYYSAATTLWTLTTSRLDERVVDAALFGIVVHAHVEHGQGGIEPRIAVLLRLRLFQRLLGRLAVLELKDVRAGLVLKDRVGAASWYSSSVLSTYFPSPPGIRLGKSDTPVVGTLIQSRGRM